MTGTDTLFLGLGTNPQDFGNQPRFPWNKGISIPQLPLRLRWCEVAIIWPDSYVMFNTRLPANLARSNHVKRWLPFIWYHLSCPSWRSPDFWTINSMFKSCCKRKPSKFHGVPHLSAQVAETSARCLSWCSTGSCDQMLKHLRPFQNIW